jgi:hypothetical protein
MAPCTGVIRPSAAAIIPASETRDTPDDAVSADDIVIVIALRHPRDPLELVGARGRSPC